MICCKIKNIQKCILFLAKNIQKCILYSYEVSKMKLKFRCEELELLYRDRNYRHRKMPYSIQKSYAMKCDFLECAETLQDIYARTSFHFEKYQDHYSIRITQQWRIELDIDKVWNVTILNILDANNHYKKNF